MSELRDALNAANGDPRPGATAQDVGKAILERIDRDVQAATTKLRAEFAHEVKALQGQIDDLRENKT